MNNKLRRDVGAKSLSDYDGLPQHIFVVLYHSWKDKFRNIRPETFGLNRLVSV